MDGYKSKSPERASSGCIAIVVNVNRKDYSLVAVLKRLAFNIEWQSKIVIIRFLAALTFGTPLLTANKLRVRVSRLQARVSEIGIKP